MYSPKIKERHIPILYRLAKSQGIPMTHVVDKIITEALKHYEKGNEISPESGKDGHENSLF